jgi:hypothetical protein
MASYVSLQSVRDAYFDIAGIKGRGMRSLEVFGHRDDGKMASARSQKDRDGQSELRKIWGNWGI